MRIAHVVLSHPATGIQGDQKLVSYLAEEQRARGLNAVVVTDRTGLFTDSYKQAGIPVFIAEDLRSNGGAASPAGTFATKIKEFAADIIHYHNVQAAKATAAAASSLKLPRIITMHTEVEPELRGLVSARLTGQEFTIVTVCKQQFDILQRTDMAGIGYYYVPNGTKIPSSADRQNQSKSRKPNLISVGALQFRKGIDISILAMFELRRRHGPSCPVLNIYGGGKGAYFIEMTEVLHLADVVKFHGFQLDILDRCPSSDILIQPSRGDLGPLVILEAMSRGMPIVASNVGDISEMLPDKKYGRVVPVESIMELADAIDSTLTDVISGQFNPDLPIQRHQSQYSSEKMADRIEDIYQSVLKL